ncbi:MAG: hypothetical protein KIT27_01710 [Legionellales bacterium]|nr:hypothetical protein [Legionellales bacterium]
MLGNDPNLLQKITGAGDNSDSNQKEISDDSNSSSSMAQIISGLDLQKVIAAAKNSQKRKAASPLEKTEPQLRKHRKVTEDSLAFQTTHLSQSNTSTEEAEKKVKAASVAESIQVTDQYGMIFCTIENIRNKGKAKYRNQDLCVYGTLNPNSQIEEFCSQLKTCIVELPNNNSRFVQYGKEAGSTLSVIAFEVLNNNSLPTIKLKTLNWGDSKVYCVGIRNGDLPALQDKDIIIHTLRSQSGNLNDEAQRKEINEQLGAGYIGQENNKSSYRFYDKLGRLRVNMSSSIGDLHSPDLPRTPHEFNKDIELQSDFIYFVLAATDGLILGDTLTENEEHLRKLIHRVYLKRKVNPENPFKNLLPILLANLGNSARRVDESLDDISYVAYIVEPNKNLNQKYFMMVFDGHGPNAHSLTGYCADSMGYHLQQKNLIDKYIKNNTVMVDLSGTDFTSHLRNSAAFSSFS